MSSASEGPLGFVLDTAILARLGALQSRDETTFRHSLAVAELLAAFARHLGLDAACVELLRLSGLLHDIGKVELNLSVLDKPGHLTANEMAHVRSHPARGHRFLLQVGGMPDVVLDICRHHHERLDGAGYPDGLTGNQISQAVRMATICNVHEALISPRQYKPGWSPQDTPTWMQQAEGFFDPGLLGQFLYLVTKQ